MNYFDAENQELHDEYEQLRRQKSALNLKLDSVDFTNQTGRIKNYEVSLEKCSCVDFIMRRKPCKHMYRLANELGIFQLISKAKAKNLPSSTESETKFVRDALKKNIDEISMDAKRELQKFTYHPREKICSVVENSALVELVSAGLLVAEPLTNDEILESLTVADIRSLCITEKPPKNIRKAELISFFKKNYPVQLTNLAISNFANKSRVDLSRDVKENLNAIHRYLCTFCGAVSDRYVFY